MELADDTKSLRIDADVHRLLAVYSAQTGQKIKAVAENAIRLHIGPACKLPRKPKPSAGGK